MIDLDGGIALDYGVTGVPETFFIDSDARIVYKHIGALNNSIIEKYLPKILAKTKDLSARF